MHNSNNKGRVEKRNSSKCEGVLRCYSPLQSAYATRLEEDESVLSFTANVPLQNFEGGESYTTDFFIQKTDGDIAVRECCFRKLITKPANARLLQASYDYWTRRGVTDWGIVIDRADEQPPKNV